MKPIRSNAGFTLVELITVILILGILAATALPKFIDVTDKAKVAAHDGVGGNFAAAIALAHAQWIANGANKTAGNIAGFGSSSGDVYANASGWPINSAGNTGVSCDNVWNALMQNPPETGNATAAPNGYTVSEGTTCGYAYNATASYTTGGTQGSISYNTGTGAVTVTAAVAP
jgi:prepilin-type N-terminal cleavage/methylation domain-containing protein